MARWFRTLMIGVLVAASVLTPTVRAAGGRIVFTGSILEATCVAATAEVAALVAQRFNRPAPPGRCALRGGAAGQNGPAYRLQLSDLQRRAGDPLLTYFAGYADAGGTAVPRLVIQTFD